MGGDSLNQPPGDRTDPLLPIRTEGLHDCSQDVRHPSKRTEPVREHGAGPIFVPTPRGRLSFPSLGARVGTRDNGTKISTF